MEVEALEPLYASIECSDEYLNVTLSFIYDHTPTAKMSLVLSRQIQVTNHELWL